MTDKEEILIAIAELKSEVRYAIERADEDRLIAKDHEKRISKLEHEKTRLYGIVAGISLVIGFFMDKIKAGIGF